MLLENLGLNDHIKNKLDPLKLNDFNLARVLSVNKDNYLIFNGEKEIISEITGNLLFRADSPLDFPTVGDWVYVQYFDNDTFAVIHDVVPRNTVLKRKSSGKKIEFQLIAANIDTGFIIQSLDENFNLRRLERYLAMINEENIQPVVLLSKSDFLSVAQLKEKTDEIHALMPEIPVFPFSNISGAGLNKIKELLLPGFTFCLLGSSGVGKTTLINKLIGDNVYNTNEVREHDHRGRHTTTSRHLIILHNGAMVIDTPGMRELANFEIETGVSDTFSEISQLEGKCRFSNCSHTEEKGCAVLGAIDSGEISEKRYQNFIKMTKESAYYERSYLEKRQRDKQFGKMCRSVMKNNKKK